MITVELSDDNGDPVTTDAVTAHVTRDDDATSVVGSDEAPAAATDHGLGVWGVEVPAQSQLAGLTATWTVADLGELTTYAEVVGGRLFTPAQLRASDMSMSDATKVTAADVADVTAEVEDEFARICGVSFIPRGAVQTLAGGARTLLLAWPLVNRVVSVTDRGDAVAATASAAGELKRSDGWYFLSGPGVRVVYEHGWPKVPADVRKAGLLRARHRINASRSGVPDRATAFASSDGGTFTLATPGRGGSETGIPDVDAVLRRYDCRGV